MVEVIQAVIIIVAVVSIQVWTISTKIDEKGDSECFEGYKSRESKCYHIPPEFVSSRPNPPDSCKLEVVSMFFSWVAYDPGFEDIDLSQTPNFSFSNGYKRLKGCGLWKIRNVFYNFEENIFKKEDYSISFTRQLVLVVTSEDYNVALIVFRGTESNIFDWSTDFDAKQSPCIFNGSRSCGMIHRGMAHSFNLVESDVFEQMKLYLDHGYHIIVTGHSKGAAVSSLNSFYFLSRYPEFKDRITSYSFGSPRIGDEDFVQRYHQIVKNSHRYVTHYFNDLSKLADEEDVVTHVPPKKFGSYSYAHTKNLHLIRCNRSFIGNFDSIPGVSVYYYQMKEMTYIVPSWIGCHFQQPYLDGLIQDINDGFDSQIDPKKGNRKLDELMKNAGDKWKSWISSVKKDSWWSKFKVNSKKFDGLEVEDTLKESEEL